LDQRADGDAGGPGGALLLSGIIGGIVALVGSGGSETGVGISSLVGVLVTLFLAYLVGGYVAGRMASRSGAKHDLLGTLLGVLVPVLMVVDRRCRGVRHLG
jgi:hypothetical protein